MVSRWRLRAVDALATLAFDLPAGRRDRSAFFRDELEQFSCSAAARQCADTAVVSDRIRRLGRGGAD